MITTTEKKFLKNFTTMANVINHIDEDGILKVERREGDLVVMSAEKYDQLCEETLSILALVEGIQGCDGDCENCEYMEDCPLVELAEDMPEDEKHACEGCPFRCKCKKF